jgi:uncharacterized protein YjbI with pentapeptide repeats
MTQIIKPMTLGVMTKPERRRGGATLIVTTFGLFPLDEPCEDRYLADAGIWPMVAQQFPEGTILDLGMPKPCGEVLVGGMAMSPTGEPVGAVTLDVQVAGIAKRLVVFGDRMWQLTNSGYVFTQPKPFTHMLLGADKAFGGPLFKPNLRGRGHDAERRLARGEPVLLPNMEDARRLIKLVSDVPAPVDLGPIDIVNSDRTKYAGTYDDTWLKLDAPGLPQDADPRLFLIAPEDQRIGGHFTGTESFRFSGFSTNTPELAGQLPGFRSRIFVMRTSEPRGVYELPVRIDTLVFLPTVAKGVVISRGSIPLSDIDCADASAVLVAYERQTDAPRPTEHYVQLMTERSNLAKPSFSMFDDGPLVPDEGARALEARLSKRRAYHEADRARRHRVVQLLAEDAFRATGLPIALMPAVPEPEPTPDFVPTPEEVEQGRVDFGELHDGLMRLDQEVRAKVSKELGGRDMDAVLADLAGIKAKGGGPGEVAAAIGQSIPDFESILKEAKPEPLVVPDADPYAPAEAKERTLAAQKNAESINSLLDSLALGDLKPPAPDANQLFEDARKRFLERKGMVDFDAIETQIRGVDLSALGEVDRQFSSGDIKRPDTPEPTIALSSILDDILKDISPEQQSEMQAKVAAAKTAMDEGAKKIGEYLPRLQGDGTMDSVLAELNKLSVASNAAPDPSESLTARVTREMDQAIQKLKSMREMVEDGEAAMRRVAPMAAFPMEAYPAEVSERLGDLVRASATAGMDLTKRDMAGATLPGINLSGRDLSGSYFERADLRGACFRDCRLQGTVFAEADLTGADFTGSDLTDANLGGAKAGGAIFDNCRLKNMTVLSGSFAGASFRNVRLENLMSYEVSFAGADFSGSNLHQLMLSKVDLTGVNFSGATIFEAVTMDCPMEDINADNASITRMIVTMGSVRNLSALNTRFREFAMLTDIDVSQARLDGADFEMGSLRGAKLDGASVRRVRFKTFDLGKINALGADFSLCDLDNAVLSDAVLRRCDFYGANLHAAQLRKADLTGSSLRSANLYQANLEATVLTLCDLSDANTSKTVLEVVR